MRFVLALKKAFVSCSRLASIWSAVLRASAHDPSVERAEASEDPRFDGNGLRMLAAFDARRVVPVLIVMCRPSFVYLFLNPLPWSDGVPCCGLCGATVCACSWLN